MFRVDCEGYMPVDGIPQSAKSFVIPRVSASMSVYYITMAMSNCKRFVDDGKKEWKRSEK